MRPHGLPRFRQEEQPAPALDPTVVRRQENEPRQATTADRVQACSGTNGAPTPAQWKSTSRAAGAECRDLPTPQRVAPARGISAG
eukprot:11219109-Lingulodinium_polyedra.AAC.1